MVRTGTDGLPSGSTIVDPLITATDAARVRGIVAIAASLRQSRESHELPLSADAMQIGTVQAVNADGTSLVSMVGGGVIRASSDSFPVNQPVFVKGGQIVSAAPGLVIIPIEV